MTSNTPLLQVRDLKKHFPIRQGLFRRQIDTIRAIDGLTFDIHPGRTLALVGPKGSGKSTTGRTILQLLRPTSGRVLYNGRDLTKLSESNLRPLRRHLQIIFHDPYTALNPRLPISDILQEPLTIHPTPGQDRRQRVQELLLLVGLNPYYTGRYPHEFTGLQRQKLNLARALATNPTLLIADEPTATLDPAVAPQFINLLAQLKQQLNLTYLLLSTDLTTIHAISDHIAILYQGRIIEHTTRDTLLTQPLHPYTQTLISTLPLPDPTHESRRHPLTSIPNPQSPISNPQSPPACPYAPHCPYATNHCLTTPPPLRDLAPSPTTPHLVACHHAETFQHPSSLHPLLQEKGNTSQNIPPPKGGGE